MSEWKKWALKAYPILHKAYLANKNHGVPEEWFAGLVAVECAGLHPKARRYEKHVYTQVSLVRNGKVATQFPGFNSGKLKAYITNPSTSITDLADLATSFGLGQIMGYHYLNKWGLLPEAFSNLSVSDSTMYTLRMMAEGMGWARKLINSQTDPDWSRYYEYLMRWWNTGSCTGKTYHPDYVTRATEARNAYKAVMDGNRDN